MKTYLLLGTIFVFIISVFNEIKSQELSADQQVFCKYLYSVFSDRKVKKFIFSDKSSNNNDLMENEIIILSDSTPFCCDNSYNNISYQNMSFKFCSGSYLFFYAIRCPVIIDSLNIKQVSGMISLSVSKCRENHQIDYLVCTYYFQLNDDKWEIKSKKNQKFKK